MRAQLLLCPAAQKARQLLGLKAKPLPFRRSHEVTPVTPLPQYHRLESLQSDNADFIRLSKSINILLLYGTEPFSVPLTAAVLQG